MVTSSAWIVSSGVVGVALVLQTSLQWALNFSFAGPPSLSCLKPLFVINGIIFTLACFHHGHQDPQNDGPSDQTELHDSTSFGFNAAESTASVVHDKYKPEGSEGATARRSSGEGRRHEQKISGRVVYPEILPEDLSPPPLEKPPVPMRLGRQITIKAGSSTLPQASRTQNFGENETMEDTWKKIREEKSSPPWRHLTKSETWQSRGQDSNSNSNGETSHVVKKSETFKERRNFQPLLERIPTWLSMKKEASLGRDELNRRVEAFIKKFNEEIRLQRLESLKRFKLLGRGFKL